MAVPTVGVLADASGVLRFGPSEGQNAGGHRCLPYDDRTLRADSLRLTANGSYDRPSGASFEM